MLAPSPIRSVRNLHASSTIACALLFVTAAGVSAARAAEHTLMPSPKTVHIGYFLATVKPVLTIDSGDIVTIESAASVVPSVVDQSGVVPPSAVPQYQRDIYGEVKDRGPGPHILTGPIEIRDDTELTHLADTPIAPNGTRALNYAFDITPADWDRALAVNLVAHGARFLEHRPSAPG